MSVITSPESICTKGTMPHGILAAACMAPVAVRQKTLCGTAQCSGIGVHSGERVNLRLLPADPDTGIVFVRTDLKNGARQIKARYDNVIDTQMCTVIGNPQGGKVATIEHLMAALRAADIDNAMIEVDGPEVPVMDGSADSFVFLIEMAGVKEQNALRREIVMVKPVEVAMNGKVVSLSPADAAQFSVQIAFDNALIGTQDYSLTLSQKAFKTEISRARTFGFLKDVERMAAAGLARGGSLDNAVVIDGDRVMNEGGLRYGNEFVRHKTLDAVGDIALAGAPIRGHYKGILPGHAMNNALLRALFADPTTYVIEGESQGASASI